MPVKPATKNAPPHDWLVNPGGSIGFAMPVAIGAAVACPDRKVLCLQSDGAGMYTNQALWTMARESLDIVTLVFANRTYEILKGELRNVGAGEPGRKARDMLEIGRSEHCPGDFFKSFAEFFKVAGADGHSGSGRMPAEFEQKAGVALGNKIQRVT